MNAQHMSLLITINGNLQTVTQNYLGIQIQGKLNSELLFSYQSFLFNFKQLKRHNVRQQSKSILRMQEMLVNKAVHLHTQDK